MAEGCALMFPAVRGVGWKGLAVYLVKAVKVGRWDCMGPAVVGDEPSE